MRLLLASALAALLVPTTLGCNPDVVRYGPPAPCTGSACAGGETGSTPTTSTTGGGTGTGGGGGAGGAQAAAQDGSVGQVDDTFAFTVDYLKPASISAYANGASVTTTYDQGKFSFASLTSGAWWFKVDNPPGGLGLMPTISSAPVPTAGLKLPVLLDTTMQEIANTLPVAPQLVVSPSFAHVAVIVTKNAAPAVGIQVPVGTGGATIAYDSGAGYSTTATATGGRGVILLFNSTLTTAPNIKLTDNSNPAAPVDHVVEILALTGATTIVRAELQ